MANTKLLKINDTLQNGKYRILKVLGKGGFGITYLAQHKVLKGNMAIKELFLSAAEAYCTRTSDNTVVPQFEPEKFEEFRAKFNDEAHTLFQLKGIKGVVQVNDTFEENGTSYFVMEFIQGQSLSHLIKNKGILTEQQAVEYTVQILETMEQVHKKGILHRDIKPDNILIDQNNKPVIVDFGIAREYEQDVTLTQTTFRTPGYYAPEQASKKAKRGAYTDIYSIGATLYYMLTGTKPETIEDRNLEGLTPPKEHNPAISDSLNNIIIKALTIRPHERYQYCHEMIQAINNRGSRVQETETTLIDDPNTPDTEATIIETDISQNDATIVEPANSEEALWEQAKYADDIAAVKKYLQKYPNGTHSQEAKRLIGKLLSGQKSKAQPPKAKSQKPTALIIGIAAAVLIIAAVIFFMLPSEQSDWEKAQAANTISAYKAYITAYPQGKFIKLANENIDWINVQTENTSTSYNTFLKNYPKSNYTKIANDKIQKIQFDSVILLQNSRALLQYIQHYPNGTYIEDAKSKLEELRKDSIKNINNQKLKKYKKFEGIWYCNFSSEDWCILKLKFSFDENSNLIIKNLGLAKNKTAGEWCNCSNNKFSNVYFDGVILKFTYHCQYEGKIHYKLRYGYSQNFEEYTFHDNMLDIGRKL